MGKGQWDNEKFSKRLMYVALILLMLGFAALWVYNNRSEEKKPKPELITPKTNDSLILKK